MENSFIQFSLVILFLPLFAFLIQIFFGKRLPRGGDWVSISAIAISHSYLHCQCLSLCSQNTIQNLGMSHLLHGLIWASSK